MKKVSFIKKVAVCFLLFQVLSVSVLADGSFYTASSENQRPDLSAQSYIISDANTGEILFSQDENRRMPIASTTKIMTCLVVLENSKLDDVVTVKAEDCGIEGSSVYLYEGEKLTVRDLLYALMLESANDAAVCLANFVSGSNEEFCKLMNDKAKSLGLLNTNFNNPHGLEDPEHYSTAYDMSRIWISAMENPTFREIVSTKTYRIDLSDDESYRFLSNHNKLLKTYEFCIGGKTGYTKTAGRCLVTGAENNGVELVMVTLNAPDDWSDHEKMFDYAFSLYSDVDVATSKSVSVSLSVVGGDKNVITLTNKDPLTLTVRDITKLSSHVEAPHFIYAPVKALDKPLANVVYTYNDEEVARLPLYPENKVSQVKRDGFFKRIFKFIFN